MKTTFEIQITINTKQPISHDQVKTLIRDAVRMFGNKVQIGDWARKVFAKVHIVEEVT